MKFLLGVCALCLMMSSLYAENGHQLWLRGKNPVAVTVKISGSKNSAILAVAKQELEQGWKGKTGATVLLTVKPDKQIKNDGFKLSSGEIQANTETGVLYGVYDLLRRQQTGEEVKDEVDNPSYEFRILDHWDNQNGTIERGYAGRSIFWRNTKDSLGVTDADRKLWKEYARANASVGINGAVLNNVNANPEILTSLYLARVKAIADELRPYGMKVYLSAKFSAPSQIGGLKTCDPLAPEVIKWWKDKAKEIYAMIPDFGGFLVKANSEGQPGPQDYKRTHAEGANMMADALKPYGGIVMWRAFVYSASDEDRAKQAYKEFLPLDGQFRDNVIIQVKNGPIDFMPREPFSPLFGAMKKTSLMPEVQITQEYLGHSIHLVFLSTMWEEFLKSDTYQEGEGSTVARCTDGSIFSQKHTAIAGVSNIGLDVNWCGHIFAQSNWYAFGRLAWDNSLKSEQIADEWIKLTLMQNNRQLSDVDWQLNVLCPVKQMMLDSREAAVNYMMPLGLHHIMSSNEHYGPGPWWAPARTRKDWTPPYYHQADSIGIGFNRTHTGSNAVSQYHEPLNTLFDNIQTCPDAYMLWFHHASWDFKMKNGRTLWDEMCYRYDKGVRQVRQFQAIWDQTQLYMDADRFAFVQSKLREQSRNAQIWKDACLLYFQTFSKKPIPSDIERPMNDLNTLISEDNRLTQPVRRPQATRPQAPATAPVPAPVR